MYTTIFTKTTYIPHTATSGNHKNLTDQDITEMILELNSDAHPSEDEDPSAQSDNDTGDTTDTNFTHWTDNTNC